MLVVTVLSTYQNSTTIWDYCRPLCSGSPSSHPLQHHYLKALERQCEL